MFTIGNLPLTIRPSARHLSPERVVHGREQAIQVPTLSGGDRHRARIVFEEDSQLLARLVVDAIGIFHSKHAIDLIQRRDDGLVGEPETPCS